MSNEPCPDGLAKAGSALWVAVVSKYTLRVDELAVLEAACKTADKVAMLEDAWVELGRPYMTRGSMGQDVIHPLIGEQRTQNAALAALLGKLKLPDDGAVGLPNQQRDAAQSRWAAEHGKGA